MADQSPGDALIDSIAEAVFQKVKDWIDLKQRLLEIDDAAQYLGMSASALRQKACLGEIPVVRIDARLRFDRKDLDRFIDQAKRTGV